MWNSLKKILFSESILNDSVFECRLCQTTFNIKERPSEEYQLCRACFKKANDHVESMIESFEMLKEKANKAGQAGNSYVQMHYLKEILARLTEYKESYYNKGVNFIAEDINQLIEAARKVRAEAAKEARESRRRRVKMDVSEMEAQTGEQWKELRAAQTSALKSILNLYDTIDSKGYGLKDGRSLANEVLQTAVHFLAYIAIADGDLTELESQVIKDYLSVGRAYAIDTEASKKYIIENPQFAEEIPSFMDITKKFDEALIEAGERSEGTYDTMTGIVTLFGYLGRHFLYESCNDIDINKSTALYEYLLHLNEYLEDNGCETEYLGEFQEIDSEGVAVTGSSERTGSDKSLEQLLQELNELIGLARVKKDLNSLVNLIKVQKIREERGFSQPAMSLHLVFSGNPGTGKTTVARLLAEIYKALGLVSKGQLIETDRSGLVAGYVGQTALKTQEVISKAKGGILFIDEAYSLTENRGEADFGTEAIDTLVKAMEDNRADLVIIVAGYPEPMERFLDSNPGLRSRFNKFISFDDYSAEELLLILKSMCKKTNLSLSSQAEAYAYSFFQKRCDSDTFANARDVRNFFEKALVNQADRLAHIEDLSDEMLFAIEYDDIKDMTC
ncbi:AAA ATPase central domain protein [Desulfitobacterium hafniense DCB-2]|uniref:AAA ATPase central domain protein n=1 Tax=Desulfitobacterium hafniense (strain DSM 10664 / DCB-2) TaxID=272564 RepID=B8G2H7_DESHD|nr:AAA family ATPase [Desulfitobacterium hafniense]ACL21327.1 AAA ATPase central domain protein [Desulfitobacterium hafniense DCB-2]